MSTYRERLAARRVAKAERAAQKRVIAITPGVLCGTLTESRNSLSFLLPCSGTIESVRIIPIGSVKLDITCTISNGLASTSYEYVDERKEGKTPTGLPNLSVGAGELITLQLNEGEGAHIGFLFVADTSLMNIYFDVDEVKPNAERKDS